MTNRFGILESAVVRSSVMPSLKYSCCGSPLMLVKGRTAIEGTLGSGGAGFCAGGIDAVVVGGRSERCCTNTITATMSASPANEKAPRQYLRGTRCVFLVVAAPSPGSTRNTRTGSAIFLTDFAP